MDDGEKGVGKALTYAEKYFMLKFFNIPTDKDDPDSFQKKRGHTAPVDPAVVADSIMQKFSACTSAEDLKQLWIAEQAAIKALPLEWVKTITTCKDKVKEGIDSEVHK